MFRRRLFSGTAQVRRAALALDLAGGEGLLPDTTEDDVSTPVLAAWRARDAAAVAATPLFVALRTLLTRAAPLATRSELALHALDGVAGVQYALLDAATVPQTKTLAETPEGSAATHR